MISPGINVAWVVENVTLNFKKDMKKWHGKQRKKMLTFALRGWPCQGQGGFNEKNRHGIFKNHVNGCPGICFMSKHILW
jgi:hypothetical protein